MPGSASTRSHLHRSGRAAPMSPPERRAAIIDATIPLLREAGVGITTRRIAEAAQVAEGTIFSVFPDKATLIAAAVEAALAPDAPVEQLRAIDPSLPLEARLTAAVATLQAHFGGIWSLLVAVGPEGARRPKPSPAQAFVQFGPVLVDMFESVAPTLRIEPADAARTLLALTLGSCHPAVVEQPIPHHEIAALFVDGIRKKRR